MGQMIEFMGKGKTSITVSPILIVCSLHHNRLIAILKQGDDEPSVTPVPDPWWGQFPIHAQPQPSEEMPDGMTALDGSGLMVETITKTIEVTLHNLLDQRHLLQPDKCSPR